MTIYGHQASRASRAYWLMREMGIEFNEVDTGGPVTGYNAVRDTPEFLKMNPNRLIPVMQDGDLVLYESLAICLYLAKKYGGPLAPADPKEEARMNMWALWTVSTSPGVEQNFLGMLFDKSQTERNTKNLQAPMKALNNELAGKEYLVGNRFTVADIMVGSVVGQYGRAIKFDFSAFPNVQEWVARVTKRPAFYPPRGMKVKPDGVSGGAGTTSAAVPGAAPPAVPVKSKM